MTTEIAPRFEFTTELASSAGGVLAGFLERLTPTTRRGYVSDLEQFRKWAGAPSQEAALDALIRVGHGNANQLIMSYHASMKEQKLRSSTINRRLSAIRSIITYVRTIGLITWSLDVKGEKVEPTDMRGPDLAEVKAMINQAGAHGNDKLARRDQAIVVLTYDLGLRRAELCGLDLGDVELEEGIPAAVWIIGKGKRERQRLTVPKSVGKVLARWIQIRGEHEGPLFHRLDGREPDPDVRLSGESVRLIMGKLGSAVKASRKVRPHGLRHTAITTALNSGRDIRDVRKFSRHATLDMVLRYDDQRQDTAGEIAGLLASQLEQD
jgi:integrase/recombinase XerC